MKTLEKHFHEECTGGYPLRVIIDSLTDDEIEDSVKAYAKNYAIEAIKADRERIKAGHTKDLHPALFSDLSMELNKDIDNLRIILP